MSTNVETSLAPASHLAQRPRNSRATHGQTCIYDRWEAAYRRFETQEQELRKFLRRLAWLGAGSWPRDARIVEICCGRGGGLAALAQLGFTRLAGVDLSAKLLSTYRGPAECYVADCRELPFDDGSQEIVIVQGGLHHLPKLPEDLVRTVGEVARVLCGDGRFVVVEPWMTPFLAALHQLCRVGAIRHVWPRLDAYATMAELEQPIFGEWLTRPEEILQILGQRFDTQRRKISRGKLNYVGRVRRGAD